MKKRRRTPPAGSPNITRQQIFNLIMPFLLIILAFLLSSVWIVMMGKNPVEAFALLIKGAFGSPVNLVNTIKKSVPIAFCTFAVIVSMKGNAFNIGAEGQFVFGAIGATLAGNLVQGVSAPIHIALCILASALFGMLFGLFPTIMHRRRGVDLLVIFLLMNNVAEYFLQYFVLDLFKSENALVPSSRPIQPTAELPYLLRPPYRMTIAILFVLVCAMVLSWFFNKTVAGYEMCAVGQNRDAAFYAGIPTGRYTSIALLISCALAGIGGGLEVLGTYHCLYTEISPGFGYDGIPIALLSNANPLLAVVGSVAFGALRNGSLSLQAKMGLSSEIVSVIQGSLILVIASNYFIRYLLNRRKRG